MAVVFVSKVDTHLIEYWRILLWQWNEFKRPFLVYQEERIKYHRRDVIPRWLNIDFTLHTHCSFCQCHLVSADGGGWHRPGTLYHNVVKDLREVYTNPCSCFKHVGWRYPIGYTEHYANYEVAIGLSRIVMRALQKSPPPVRPRSESWHSFLTSMSGLGFAFGSVDLLGTYAGGIIK